MVLASALFLKPRIFISFPKYYLLQGTRKTNAFWGGYINSFYLGGVCMRIFVVKKNTIIRTVVFVLLLVGAIVYTQVSLSDAAPVSSQSESMPVCRVDTDENVVALTFDTAFGMSIIRRRYSMSSKKRASGPLFSSWGSGPMNIRIWWMPY